MDASAHIVRVPALGSALAWGLACLCTLSACGVDEGFVELNWQFVDNRQRKIYPDGGERDVCGLTGTISDTEKAKYDLRVQLTISESDCAGGPTDEACQVIPPRTFSCRRARASLTDVPANEDVPYLMTVDVVVDPVDGEPFVPLPTCASLPGPRERRVLPGGTVDLQVFQIVMNGIDPGADTAADRRLHLIDCDPNAASANASGDEVPGDAR